MLKSCKYCNRIHDSKYDCGRKPVRIKPKTNQNKFRCTRAWKDKSTEIRIRDVYLCQLCIRGLYGPMRYSRDLVEVHHIVPIAEDYDRRLDNNNLITLCEKHHEMAEGGRVPRGELLKIAKEQEKVPPPGRKK